VYDFDPQVCGFALMEIICQRILVHKNMRRYELQDLMTVEVLPQSEMSAPSCLVSLKSGY